MSEIQRASSTPNVYERVTLAIVNSIEQRAHTYRMPWVSRQDRGFSPVRVGSGKTYRGVNVLVLWAQAQSKGYGSSLWGTYRQWSELGAQVRKGERGSPVVYWGTILQQKEPADETDGRNCARLFAKGFTVFCPRPAFVVHCHTPARIGTIARARIARTPPR